MQRVRISSQNSSLYNLEDSRLSISPKIRLDSIKSSILDPCLELDDVAINGQSLIPGLPDDVALNCLLRVPVRSHSCCRLVCKRWNLLLGSKERFFTKRKEFGFYEPWLFIFAYHKCSGKQQWLVLDLTRFAWHAIPAMPCRKKFCPHGFRSVSLSNEGVLFVIGGVVSDVDFPLDKVLKYELYKNCWTVMNQMTTARSFFASGVIDGVIYVAGGNNSFFTELDSAEVLDSVTGNWRRIANMGIDMASYDAAVLDGKLLVTEGWSWPFYASPRGQIYDPRSNIWENMAVGLREGWTGSSVVIYEHLFVVSDHERMKLKVYDVNSDSWEIVEGSPLPEQICKPFSVNTCNSEIYVVGRDLRVAVGRILRVNVNGESDKKSKFAVLWHVVNVPEIFTDMTPSSSQVLFA